MAKKKNSKYLQSIIDSVMGATPKNRKLVDTFDEYYTKNPVLAQEDQKQSEAMMVPYYENLISNSLEDLNNYVANANVSYQRTLRRARNTLAKGGGAIGTEREGVEKDITQDKDQQVGEVVKETERKIGTEKTKQAGYNPVGIFQEGSLVADMKSSIAEQNLWYRNQRAETYNANVARYYDSDSKKSYNNKKLY